MFATTAFRSSSPSVISSSSSVWMSRKAISIFNR
jgi:hypothetical protein